MMRRFFHFAVKMVQLKASLNAGCSHCAADESVQVCRKAAGSERDGPRRSCCLSVSVWSEIPMAVVLGGEE